MSNAPSQRFGTAHGRRLPKDQRNSALWTPGLGRQSHNKEVSVDSQQLRVLQNLFETHPTLVAAKNVIESRLLAGGLTLRRNGQVVDLTPEFRQHINDHWTQFARDAIGAFLVGGFVVVSYEDEVPECATTRRRHKRARFQKDYKSAKDDSTIAAANGLLRQNVVPIVAPSDSYKLAFEMGGRAGYQRVYKVYKSEIDNGLGIDDEAMLFIRDSPDNNGNVNSPMAAVHHISSFVDGLINMASIAETSRAQPPLVTQIKKVDTHNGVAPADMFFDSESRGISRDQSHEDNAHNARALQMQLQLCAILNQASVGGPRAQMGPSTSSGAPTGAGEAASRLFTLPSDQEMVPHAPIPQTRADLEGLLRLSVDFMCTAIGVPSSLLFEGRYASRTTAQLSLLNATVQQLASSIDSVLTEAYIDIYGDGGINTSNEMKHNGGTTSDSSFVGCGIELVTSTSSLSASEEVLALFTGGLADFEAAAPSALHAIGLSQQEIEAALDRRRALVKKQEVEEKSSRTERTKTEDATAANSQPRAAQPSFAFQKVPDDE